MHSRDVQNIFWTMVDRGHPVTEIAKCLKVGRGTLYRWKKLGPQHGPRAALVRGGRKLKPQLTLALQQHFQAECTTTLARAAQVLWTNFGVRVTPQAVWKFCRRAGLTCKKASKRYTEMSQERAADFLERARTTFGPNTYILDEAAFFINHVRSYAWSQRGTRVVVPRPGNRGRAHSLLLCISTSGVLTYELYEGAVTAKRFSEFLQRVPHNSRLVLDNAQIHHATNVLRRQGLPTIPELAASRQIEMAYLPPYAPLLNPVELMFNTIRTFIRREAPRDVSTLHSTIQLAVAQLSPGVCAATVQKVWH